MSLASGTRIGPYEVAAQIGVGGMGEVYRATDTKLKRQVAIKVLPASVAGDAERLARFQREAEVLASLNHANIAGIYGLEEADGLKALVMELVEGPTLADRIAQGASPVDEVLPIARQIAEALEAAHEQGIVHRDLKPANVKVRPDGTVKVLDFGLAKAMELVGTRPADVANSPTLSMQATMAGVILGTAAYMSPEQAKGRPVDKRADIWAFGVVVYELLTGEQLFKGDSVADTLAQVLTKDVDVARVPGVARALIAACLHKDPKARLRDIGDAQRLIGQASAPAADGAARASIWPWAAAAVLASAAGVAFWAPWRSAPPVSELRFQIPREASQAPVLSPDGQRVAMFGRDAIAIREMNALETRALPSGRPAVSQVIWSSDSRSLAYQSTDFTLMKVAIDGSPPVRLADLPALGGGSWSEDGVIILGIRRGGLQRVPASGGTLTPVTTLSAGQTEHWSPQFIGAGRFLYMAGGEEASSGIYLASLTDPNGTLVLPLVENGNRNFPVYSYVPPSSGAGDAYILYTSQNVLLAQTVDPSSLAPKGPATALGQDVAAISASRNGTLIHVPPNRNADASELRWLDRSGKEISDMVGAKGGGDATISPGGKRWAVSVGGDIWLHEVAGGAPSRFTFEPGTEVFLTWSPDDQWIAYAAGTGRAHDRILRKNTVTSAAAETLVSGGTDFMANDWSRDGRFLLLSDVGTSTGRDLWTLNLKVKGAKPVPYLQTPAAEHWGAFSPDGHWIAYQSDESGQAEVYVQSFPLGGGKFQVSTGGGMFPRWRADARELYFVSGGRLTAVRIQTSPRFEAGAPQTLFGDVETGNIVAMRNDDRRQYDVGPDGNRFLVRVRVAGAREVPPATVVINWQAGLKTPQ